MRLNKHKDTDPEIINYIAEHIDHDIDCLLENKPLAMGNRKIPEFDEYKVYQNVLTAVNKKKERRIISILKWACVIALFLFNAGYFTYQFVTKDETSVYREICAAKGERLVVLLGDGSRVWLNADSKLVYPEHFTGDERRVSLSGEAYFEIKKNPDNPFMVTAGEMKVRVTGTSFNVCAYPSDKEIVTTLDEGKISIGRYTGNLTMYDMIPGQTAVYEKGSRICKINSNANYKDASGWKENRLTFRNISLPEVLKVLSRKFDVKFEVPETKITSFTYNFICKANDLSNILEMMESITPVKFERISEGVYTVK